MNLIRIRPVKKRLVPSIKKNWTLTRTSRDNPDSYLIKLDSPLIFLSTFSPIFFAFYQNIFSQPFYNFRQYIFIENFNLSGLLNLVAQTGSRFDFYEIRFRIRNPDKKVMVSLLYGLSFSSRTEEKHIETSTVHVHTYHYNIDPITLN